LIKKEVLVVNAVALKNWLLGARPMPDENKIHLGGLLLALVNLPLWLVAYISPSALIGIGNDYPSEASDMLSGYLLLILFWTPPLTFAFLFLRCFAKRRLTYYTMTGLIIFLTLTTLALICWEYYTVNYIYQHFQPLY